MKEEGLKIAILCCNYTNFAGEEDLKDIPVKISVKRFPCGGHIEVTDILRAMREGAEGVLVAVCEKGKCHNEIGNVRGAKKIIEVRRILSELGLSEERVCAVFVRRQDTGDFVEKVKEFYGNLLKALAEEKKRKEEEERRRKEEEERRRMEEEERKKAEEKKVIKVEVVEERVKEGEAEASEGYQVVCIAESINIMSKKIGSAMKARDPDPIQKMAREETELGADYLDLNIGPAKKDGPEFASWIVKIVEDVVDTPLSLDTTNPDAMIAGVRASKKPETMLINSITIQKNRLEKLGPLAAEIGCNVVALLWGESGLPRDANERAALVVDLVTKLNEYGIPNEKIWVDPILTPITLGADQILEILNFMAMLQDIVPGVKTTIGLSNVSNGVAAHLRPYLNRAMLMMLMKYNIYSAIVDVYDKELVEIAKGKHPEWVQLVHRMLDGDEPDPKALSPKELEIYKTVRVLTGKTIFSESWLEI
jgi:coenzyme F420-reducing hydrogenase delta subunit